MKDANKQSYKHKFAVWRKGREPKLTGRIVVPGDVLYNASRAEFNTFFNKFPLVIVFAKETQDVVNAIRWARYWNVPIRMRSGRHNYEGLSVVDGGIVIDVSEMKQIDIDYKRGTVTVQAGLKNAVLYDVLGSNGLVVPGGLCPTTGIAGLALGGGASALVRQYGLTCDHLLELEMIDARGRLLRANANCHSDLLWASRGGGGGNFGICTTFRFRTHRIDTVAYAYIGWELCDLEPVLRTWQKYIAPGADQRLTPLLLMFNETQQLFEFPIFMQGVYLGSAEKLRQLLQPLLHAGSPQKVIIEEIPWLEAVNRIAATQPTTPTSFKSTVPFFHNLLPDRAITLIRRFIETPPPGTLVSVFLHGLGGAVTDVPNRATAYYYRQALSNINLTATWNTPDRAKQGIQWVENIRRAMLPFTQGNYVNAPDLSIRNWRQAYFGGNFKRLTRVKAKYDPCNVFHFPQSIPRARK